MKTMVLKEVQVVGLVGTEFGVVESEPGVLVITSRRAGEDWPYGIIPTSGLNMIVSPGRRYCVEPSAEQLHTNRAPTKQPENIYKP